MRTFRRACAAGALLSMALCSEGVALAVGESDADGFPNWAERVVLEWVNRARVEPARDLDGCGAACGEAACYDAQPPLAYDLRLNRAARFHSDEMRLQGYFAHDSACTLVQGIDALYPTSCDGAASCACQGGVEQCDPDCTGFADRVSRFGVSASGEIIASPTDPDQAFYGWLYESFPDATCAYVQGPPSNGHRYQILSSTGSFGAGVSGPAVGDFSVSTQAVPAQVPSGAHYPRQADSVEVWANWYDTLPPRSAQVIVDGTAQALTRARGSDQNGAYTATVSGVGAGCHRYWFRFTDGSGRELTYPTSGSLGIGPEGSCPDWDPGRPDGGGAPGLDDPLGAGGAQGGCGCATGARAQGAARADAGLAGAGLASAGLIALALALAQRVRRRANK